MHTFLENYLLEIKKEIKGLEKRVKSEGLKDPNLIDELCEKNCVKSYYEAIFLKLKEKSAQAST